MVGAEDDVGDGFDARDGLVSRDEVDDVVECCGVPGLRWWWVGREEDGISGC